MADLRNFERWDPGVISSRQVEGEGPGLGAAYDVTVKGSELRYETKEFTRPTRTVAEARTRRLHSYDVIEVSPRDDGCAVVYDATLELNGWLKIANPILALMFRRIGDKAAAGMERALEGRKID